MTPYPPNLGGKLRREERERMNQVLNYTNTLKSCHPNQASHHYYCIWVRNKLLMCFVFSKPGSVGREDESKS